MHEQQGIKFFSKPPKGKMKALLIVLAWILLWNTVFQIVHGAWHEMPIVNWAFFIAITIFFMQEELTSLAEQSVCCSRPDLWLFSHCLQKTVFPRSFQPSSRSLFLLQCSSFLTLTSRCFSTMSVSAISSLPSSTPKQLLRICRNTSFPCSWAVLSLTSVAAVCSHFTRKP